MLEVVKFFMKLILLTDVTNSRDTKKTKKNFFCHFFFHKKIEKNWKKSRKKWLKDEKKMKKKWKKNIFGVNFFQKHPSRPQSNKMYFWLIQNNLNKFVREKWFLIMHSKNNYFSIFGTQILKNKCFWCKQKKLIFKYVSIPQNIFWVK